MKPILKILNEHFATFVFMVYIIKPDNFWQKQRTSLGSAKYKFEVRNLYKEIECCVALRENVNCTKC